MKTMTCRQLGGPCDFEHHGKSAEEELAEEIARQRHLEAPEAKP